MKLRNKNTGEIKDIQTIVHEAFTAHEVEILKDLDANWEDVGDTNDTNTPLIKDEKIRKAVRTWADANEVTKVYVYGIGDGKEYIELYAKDDGVTDGRIRISLPTQDGVWIGEEYAIEELCGEEKE